MTENAWEKLKLDGALESLTVAEKENCPVATVKPETRPVDESDQLLGKVPLLKVHV